MDYFWILVIFLLTIVLYFFLNNNSDYWKIRKVSFVPPVPILGNLSPLLFLRRSPGQFLGDLYNCPQAKDQKFLGVFGLNNEPILVVRDPEVVKKIFVKDFQYFPNRSLQCYKKTDPVGFYNLFVLTGAKWKYLRTQLGPTFTSAKMKQVFYIFNDITAELLNSLEKNQKNGNGKSSFVVEAKNTVSRYTMDIISAYAFGLNSGAIQDGNSPFRYFGDKIFDMTIRRSIEIRSFFFMPWMAKIFNFAFLQQESTQFFRKIFHDAVEEREKDGISRNDFIDSLVKLKNEKNVVLKNHIGGEEEILELTEDLLLAQPILFYSAGFETTATTISMALYELAIQPDIQEKLREEIVNCLTEHGGELTFEIVSEMKYMDMVLSETLRKYPPMPFINRVCTMNYQIPDTDVVIQKNTSIFVPLYHGLHYDEKYYPEPDKFDPERFNEENKKNIQPFSYMPFGEGPRSCLGKRFALTNAKTAISLILKTYRVEASEKTEIPLVISNRDIVINAKNGNHLKFVKL